jgi:uncharacterized membrane protein YjjB (DUF3815 family)
LIFWWPTKDINCSASYPLYYTFPLFIVASITFLMLLQARLRQWPIMVFVAGAGFGVYNAATLYFNATSTTLLSAFAIGLIAQLYERIRRTTSIAITVNGILLLVPGALGVRTILKTLDGDVQSGVGKRRRRVIIIAKKKKKMS